MAGKGQFKLLAGFRRRVNNEKSLYFLNDRILVNVKEIGHIGWWGSVFLREQFGGKTDLSSANGGKKSMLTQRRKDAKPAGLQAAFFALIILPLVVPSPLLGQRTSQKTTLV